MESLVPQPSWILTAFEPFAGRASNLSAMVLAEVADERIATRTLPVVFDALASEIASLLDRRPSILILMGESQAHKEVRVERIALNIIDAGELPDNQGNAPRTPAAVPDAPLALAAPWDADAVVSALRARGVAAKQSHHAGVYACNHALYLALHQAAERSMDIIIGFLHVPRRGPLLRRRARRIAAAIPDVFATLARDRQHTTVT